MKDLTVDRRGNIFVLDGVDQQVKMFDRNGRPVRVFGRKGAGPGEFINASVISVVHDSLWVIDRQNERITAFALADRGLRSFVLPGTGRGLKRVQLVTAFGFLCSTPASTSILGGASDQVTYVLVDNTGAIQNTVLSGLPSPRSLVYTAAPANNPKNSYRGFTRQPFLHPTMSATADDARAVVLVTTAMTSGRETERVRAVKVSVRGDTLWRVALSYRGRPLRPADIKHVVDSIVRSATKMRGTVLVPNRQMIEDSILLPRFWPPVSGLVVGADGTIWLQQGIADARDNRYWRLSPTRTYEATVSLPLGFVLKNATRDYAWGWRLDRDGLPVIERFKFAQP